MPPTDESMKLATQTNDWYPLTMLRLSAADEAPDGQKMQVPPCLQ